MNGDAPSTDALCGGGPGGKVVPGPGPGVGAGPAPGSKPGLTPGVEMGKPGHCGGSPCGIGGAPAVGIVGGKGGCGWGGGGGWGTCATFATALASPPEIPGIPPFPDDKARRIPWICSGVSVATSAASAELAS